MGHAYVRNHKRHNRLPLLKKFFIECWCEGNYLIFDHLHPPIDLDQNNSAIRFGMHFNNLVIRKLKILIDMSKHNSPRFHSKEL